MPQADSRSTIPIPPLPKALPKATRAMVETAIQQHIAATEALTAFLDICDGDADLEPSIIDGRPGHDDDREGDDIQDEPHDADPDEASLG